MLMRPCRLQMGSTTSGSHLLCKVLQPLGVLKLLLKSVDLETPEAVFCVLK